MPPEIKPSTMTVSYQDERLRKWREKRAKVAERSQQERLRKADAERQKRLETFEKDKAKRIQEAAEKRAREDAERRAERLNAARARIAGRSDIAAARRRLSEYRLHAARMLAARLFAFVFAPTVAVGAYLFYVATPLYVAKAQFSLASTQSEVTEQSNLSPFGTNAISREAYLVRARILSPQMFETLDKQNNFTNHFSVIDIDPLTRVTEPGIFQNTRYEQLQKFVSVSVNGQDAMINLDVKATNPQTAKDFADTILKSVGMWLAETRGPGFQDEKAITLISPPKSSEIPLFPRRLETLLLALLTFSAIYAIGSIFLRTLSRHSHH